MKICLNYNKEAKTSFDNHSNLGCDQFQRNGNCFISEKVQKILHFFLETLSLSIYYFQNFSLFFSWIVIIKVNILSVTKL